MMVKDRWEIIWTKANGGKMNTNDYKIAAAIALNTADENTAIEGYYELLDLLASPEDKDIIREIISDEKNHRELLAKLAEKYDGNIPTAED